MEKTRHRRVKNTEEGEKYLLWGRRRNDLTDNFTLAVYMQFQDTADRQMFDMLRVHGMLESISNNMS